MLTDQDIVCFASAHFYQQSRLTVHHLMTGLAKSNRVLFVESLGLRSPSMTSATDVRKVLHRISGWCGGVRKETENLYVYSPIGIPFHGWSCVRYCNAIWLSRSLKRIMKGLRFRRPIVWMFLPTAAGAAQQLAPSLVVYHCVDDYSANPSVDAPTISRLESQAIKAADVVLTTSPKLFREKRAVHPRTYYFPNLGNIEAFLEEGHRALILMDEIASLQRPVIGFVGNVSGYKVDLELIAMLADSRPKWNFVLIGPIGEGDPSTDVRLLQDKPNVLLLGPRQANEVPQYVHAFDVCLIPYRANQTTDSVFPLKFFEYLALGKPVVSTELESLLDYKDLCYLTSREKFLSAIEAALKEDGNEARRRIEYVSGLSWSRRINDVGTIIQAALDGRGEK